jgi:hypothetical protein
MQAEGLPEGSRRLERERNFRLAGEMETTLKGLQKFALAFSCTLSEISAKVF